MVGKHDEKLDSGISSLAKCGGCKATGRIVIGSKSDIIIVNTHSMGSVLINVSVILSFLDNDSSNSPRYIQYLHIRFIDIFESAHFYDLYRKIFNYIRNMMKLT